MQKVTRIARWLLTIALPLFLLAGSIAIAVNSPWFYNYGFEKYDISQRTGIEAAELTKAASGLIDYFNSGEELITVSIIKDGEPFTLFNEREVGHLYDVKSLFRLDYTVLMVSGALVLVSAGLMFTRRDRRAKLGRGMFWGGELTLGLMGILGAAMALDFESLFWQFHLISFTNDLWLLDPTKDYLLMLFPSGFWLDAAALCAGLTAAGALALGATGWILMKTESAEGTA